MALLQFALVFGNDHFVLPVPVAVGAVFTTSHLLVTDLAQGGRHRPGALLPRSPAAAVRLRGTRSDHAG
jgi:hypothetical protein